MKRITATLITDGSSDKLLAPLIGLIFNEHATLPYQINCAENLPPLASGLRSRIESALDLFPCNFLFVHRDAENIEASKRQLEIESSWPDSSQTTMLVTVVPVRMTEAWLITNEKPIRSAVGNPNGTEPLGLPTVKNIESSLDPKEVLFSALKAASGRNSSRKRKLNPHQFRYRVSELTEDLEPLRKLKSFRHLEAQVKQLLTQLESEIR